MSKYINDPQAKLTLDERRAILLAGLDTKNMLGLEIGALCRPLVRREEGEPVIYVDHADTPTLRKKYESDRNVTVDHIVDVDAVWGQNTLREATRGRLVDYAVASHVVEHVPDLIAWLNELASVLRPTGELRLIVPDKRFLFDIFRRETSLADVLLSYINKARVPQPHSMLDFTLGVVKARREQIWRDEVPAVPERHYDWQGAVALARDIIKNGTYHDIHCWAFTPKSFAELLRDMTDTGLVDFACEGFLDTQEEDFEFYVSMRRSSDKEYIRSSWERMAAAASTIGPGEPNWQERRREDVARRRDLGGRYSSRVVGQHSPLDASAAAVLPNDFDKDAYLSANPDVAAAGIDAAEHYLRHGQYENRPLKP
ncbi:class I SAM-dependent methyltransferase [Paraburkholderia kirstenboschensis]|uniref:Methyltransferase domain-containing protein n=1 Tax=Paraburkholderia kirstenboschensis TaxID=1245436 RepID=A0ABZ0ETW7_9BURK|nr:methyltransferase domain-containing protein [Paraburkholderia kirstenboschensis]WOD20560.1 methyltransferase domain-containing protein [Paraburkholderia kirstenboschensis]